MRKIVFLLIMAMALVGFVSAHDVAHPPGVISLEAALSETGMELYAGNSDTVLVLDVLSMELPASYSALPETTIMRDFAGQPNDYIVVFTNTVQQPDYFLRL